MSRHLKIAAAQLGPLHVADTREAAAKRLVALFREAPWEGARFVVFPELALTTFFPRWWLEDQADVDRRFFEPTMPNPVTQPLFDRTRARRRVLPRLRGADAALPRRRPHPPLQHLDPRRAGRTDRRQVPQSSSAGARRSQAASRVPASGEKVLRGRRPRFPRLALHGHDHRDADLQRPAVAGGVPRARATGRRDRCARLQHADREPALPRAAGAARASPSHHGAVDGVPERNVARGDREMRRRRTASACSVIR